MFPLCVCVCVRVHEVKNQLELREKQGLIQNASFKYDCTEEPVYIAGSLLHLCGHSQADAAHQQGSVQGLGKWKNRFFGTGALFTLRRAALSSIFSRSERETPT